MTTAYTSLLGLALPVTGELSGTWGDTVNNSITSLLDTSVAGTTNVSTDGDVTLTTTTGAANTARQAILLFSGARTALRTVTAPAQSKVYTVINATTGGFSVKLVGSGPTTGLTIPNGASAVVAWNGSDFVEIGAGSIGNLVVNGTLTVTGATTLQSTLAVTGNITNTAGTANGVTYLNGSKVLTSGSALTYNGTTLTATATTGASVTYPAYFDNSGAGSGTGSRIGFRNTGASYGEIGYSYTDAFAFDLDSAGSSRTRFLIGGSEQMRLTSTGLGIGTSSIGEKLVVSGSATVDVYKLRSNTSAPASTDAFIYRPADNTIGFGTGSAEKMRLDSSGNLGIGTSSPVGLLDVSGTTPALTASQSSITVTAGTLMGAFNAYSRDSSTTSTGGVGGIRVYAPADYNTSATPSYMSFFTHNTSPNDGTLLGNPTEWMRLDKDGNLGIGTSSPAVKLQVNNAATVGLGASGMSGISPIVFADNGNAANGAYVIKAHGIADGNTIGAYRIASSPDGLNYSWAGMTAITSTSSTADTLAFYTAASNSSGATSTERMRINASGNVGIGTSSPGQRLDVSSASSVTRIAVTNTANAANGSGIQFLVLNGGSESSNVTIRADNADNTQFFNKGGERARIDSSGNVGINTSSPGQRLDVNGNIRSRDGAVILSVGTAQQGIFCTYNQILGSGTDYTPTIFSESGLGINFAVNGFATKTMSLTSAGTLLVGTTSTSGSLTNYAPVYAGSFKTAQGSVSTTSGVAATLFTAPSGFSSYFVTVWINADDVINYQAVISINTQPNGAIKLNTIVSANLFTFALSGYNVQVTQLSGGAATVNYTATRIAG